MSTKFNKDLGRTVTNRFVSDITATVYNGIVHQVPKLRVLRTMRKELDWYATKMGGISLLAHHTLWLGCVKAYNEVAKTAHSSLRKVPSEINYQEKIKQRSNAVFDAVNKKILDGCDLTKGANFVLNEKEARQKLENLTEELESSRNSDEYSPFLLSDHHENCAKDHLKFESRIYFDEKYEKYITDEETLAKVNAYIHNHACMSIQEAVGAPNYFLVRPNCKHEVRIVPLEEVLSSSVRKMQIRRKMIKHHDEMSRQEVYSRAYYAQYQRLKALWDMMPNEKLAKKMKDTKKNYRKWAHLAHKR